MVLGTRSTGLGSGLTSYLAENEKPLTTENLNELDALLFAVLCNCKFEEIFPREYEEERISVNIFAFIMLQRERDKNSDRAILLRALKNCSRYERCELTNLRAENRYAQWASFTVHINDGTGAVLIAMRGTDATVLGWTEDLLLAYDTDGTEAQKLSAEYLERCGAPAIFLTGHSKGGNDVVSAFCMVPLAIRERVIRIYNFDGPGLNDEFRERFREGYDGLQDKLINFYPQNAIIGKLLHDHPGEEHYVKSIVRENYQDKGLFGEHDPFSWSVRGGRFEETGQTSLSKWLDESLDDALSKLSNEERKHVIDVFLKYHIPSLIIGEDENAYADNKKAALEALDYIDGDQKAPEEILKPFIDLYDAALVWQLLTPEKKRAAQKLAALLIYYGLYNGREMAAGADL